MALAVPEEHFDPKIHLKYTPPAHRYTFDDLGLPRSSSSTKVAASSPFPFLSLEGVKAYRRAITTQDLLKNCAYSPYEGTLVLRNVVKYSTFIRELWTHPETLKVIEEIAGAPLVPVIPFEIGQTNIQAKGGSVEEITQNLAIEPSTTSKYLTEEEKRIDPLNEKSIIPWHYDSYPYVLVVMLSSCVGMYGGETYLRKGDGTALKVEGPSLGHAVFLQGGEIQHLAARAIGVDERIATITSMRAKVPGVFDSSYLTNVRPVSDRPTLYREWVQYRVKKMKEELDEFEKSLDRSPPDTQLDVAESKVFFEAQINYIRRTTDQMVPYQLYDEVIHNFGQKAYYDADGCWKEVQRHPEFEKRLQKIDDTDFIPHSHVWGDLYVSRKALDAGLSLQGQLGTFRWEKKRAYVMGDELLRQGLRELFFEWLRATGLSCLLENSHWSFPIAE